MEWADVLARITSQGYWLGTIERQDDSEFADQLKTVLGAKDTLLSCRLPALTHISVTQGSTYASMGSGPLIAHNDGLYFPELPRYVALRCIVPPSHGGETFLVGGRRLYEHAERMDCELLMNVIIEYTLGPFTGKHSIISTYPESSDKYVRFSDASLAAAMRVSAESLSFIETTRILARFREMIRQCEPDVEIAWAEGTTLVIDNWRMLHGRRAFSGHRHLVRVVIF